MMSSSPHAMDREGSYDGIVDIIGSLLMFNSTGGDSIAAPTANLYMEIFPSAPPVTSRQLDPVRSKIAVDQMCFPL